MEKISLKNWELFSSRHNSKNYISKDKKWMIKTSSSKNDIDLKEFEKEKMIAEGALSMNIPTPIVKDVVEIEEGGYGLIFEFVENKKSISRAISEDFNSMEENMKIFAELGKKIHNTPCDIKKYKHVEEYINSYLNKTKIFNDKEVNAMRMFMDNVEKKETCLHGDFQMGNFLVSPKGDYAIDLGLLCYGNPMYDIGMWYLFSHYNHNDCMTDHFFHMSYDKVIECWKLFIKYYFNIEKDDEREKLEEKIMPYAFLIFCVHANIRDLDEYFIPAKEWGFKDAFKDYL